MESAFGIEHADRVSKHYLGQHGPEHAHERSQHSRLRRTRRATRGAYNSASAGAFMDGHDAQVKAHPFIHQFEQMGNSSRREWGETPRTTSAARAGQFAEQKWRSSESGRHAASVRDDARGAWNPRYGARRAARADAQRQIAKANAFTRPSSKNTRSQNTGVGAVYGGAMTGVLGAAMGGHSGAQTARGGVRALREIGAGPSRLGSARIVAEHAGRKALVPAAAFGGVGALYGAAIGATERAKRPRSTTVGSSVSKRRTDDYLTSAGVLGGGAVGAQGVALGGRAVQRSTYRRAANSPAGRGSASPNKLKALQPLARMNRAGRMAEHSGRLTALGLGVGAAGMAGAAGASSISDGLDRRRNVSKSAVSAFGVEHA